MEWKGNRVILKSQQDRKTIIAIQFWNVNTIWTYKIIWSYSGSMARVYGINKRDVSQIESFVCVFSYLDQRIRIFNQVVPNYHVLEHLNEIQIKKNQLLYGTYAANSFVLVVFYSRITLKSSSTTISNKIHFDSGINIK